MTAMVFAPAGTMPPAAFEAWLAERSFTSTRLTSADEMMAMALRGRPRLVMVDARSAPEHALDACRRMKRDSYTGIVPCVIFCGPAAEDAFTAFDAGADEVLRAGLGVDEVRMRLELLLRRSDRDVHVHPSTRLPGTNEIEAEIARRLDDSSPFAVCYADLD